MSVLNIRFYQVASMATLLVLAGCAGPAAKPEGVDTVRAKLTHLQMNSQLIQSAPLEFNEAELAVKAAEEPRTDKMLGRHLMLVADRKVDIAETRARSRILVGEREQLSQQRNEAKLAARNRDVAMARGDAMKSKADAEKLRMQADAERNRSQEYQRQLGVLNAKATNRGMIMTLGDLSFATGKAQLQPSVLVDLDKLVVFLNKYENRSIVIEGNTDSVGSEALNLKLSQHRATAVRDYLVGKGINSGRLTVVANGEGNPLDTNDSKLGRQHNRRVDIVISNTEMSRPKAILNDLAINSVEFPA
ncbi:OmpA family protein [Marinomonas sp.]|uniref:OmpA family protein n=1 Tax=Marinomonas sp. TaxID=1904862 RepID=UPI003BAC25AD